MACTRPSATRAVTRSTGGQGGDRGDRVAVGVLEHGVPPAQGGQRRQGAGPGHLVADVVGGAVEACARGCAGRAGAASRPRRRARRRARRARPGPGGTGDRRGRPARAASSCSTTARIRSRARSDVARPRRPRRGRRAWRRRSAWTRARRRPGRAAAGRARGRWPTTTGVRIACTARSRASSENGSRSSTEPPPRATMTTSTRGVALEPVEAVHHLGGGALALHRGVRDLEARPRASGAGRSRPRRARRRSWAR